MKSKSRIDVTGNSLVHLEAHVAFWNECSQFKVRKMGPCELNGLNRHLFKSKDETKIIIEKAVFGLDASAILLLYHQLVAVLIR